MAFKLFLSLIHIALAVVNISDPRGVEIKHFTSPTGLTEICVLPEHLPNVIYSASDLKREKKLCDFNFYSGGSVICPKYNSTSASVMAYATASPTGKISLQNATQCVALYNDKVLTPATEKIGKFKQNEPLNDSTSTNVAAILAYYHISRALGYILNIPVATIRTMDVQSHQDVALIFYDIAQITKVSPGTQKGWDSFLSMHQGKRNDFSVYTGDQQQIFGAIIKGGGSEKAYDIETEALISATAFSKAEFSENLIQDILKGAYEPSVRELVLQTSDMADMLVIDTLLEQVDRYSGSNIETYNVYWNGTKYLSQKEADALPVADVAKMKKIRRLSLQDNDAGMNSPSNTANWVRVGKMRHISPKTYKNILILSRTPDLKKFLERETLLSSTAANRLVNSIKKLSQQFQTDCLSGRLIVDLDMNAVLKNGADLNFSKSQCN